MRNVPFAFLNEETIDRINAAAEQRRIERAKVDAFASLAKTQMSMRDVIEWPNASVIKKLKVARKKIIRRLVGLLEGMMEMSGPNSIANLERALRAQREVRR